MDAEGLARDVGLGRTEAAKIAELVEALSSHKVFLQVVDLESLRVFMSAHVFAVWDFMSLLKRLQRDLTCVDVPWVPSKDPVAARLINEIVLQEESDVAADGKGFASHFDIYLSAMAEVGADQKSVRGLIDALSVRPRFIAPQTFTGIGQLAGEFVAHTLDVALHGSTIQALAAFVLGREEVIPHMFQSLLDTQPQLRAMAPTLTYYLERHISVDAEEHGPAAWRIVQRLLARSDSAKTEFAQAAIGALVARARLWDRVSQRLTGFTPVLRQSA